MYVACGHHFCRLAAIKCSKCCTIQISHMTHRCPYMKIVRPAGHTRSIIKYSTIAWFHHVQPKAIQVMCRGNHNTERVRRRDQKRKKKRKIEHISYSLQMRICKSCMWFRILHWMWIYVFHSIFPFSTVGFSWPILYLFHTYLVVFPIPFRCMASSDGHVARFEWWPMFNGRCLLKSTRFRWCG